MTRGVGGWEDGGCALCAHGGLEVAGAAAVAVARCGAGRSRRRWRRCWRARGTGEGSAERARQQHGSATARLGTRMRRRQDARARRDGRNARAEATAQYRVHVQLRAARPKERRAARGGEPCWPATVLPLPCSHSEPVSGGTKAPSRRGGGRGRQQQRPPPTFRSAAFRAIRSRKERVRIRTSAHPHIRASVCPRIRASRCPRGIRASERPRWARTPTNTRPCASAYL